MSPDLASAAWPAATGVLGTLIGAVGAYLAARATKAPDAQAALTAGFSTLLDEYRRHHAEERARGDAALAEARELRSLVELLEERVEDLKAEIHHLREVLMEHEITVPPRRAAASATA